MSPKLVFATPGWDRALLAKIGDENVSIENSVAIHGNTLFFANSGGLAQAWDLAGLRQGRDPRRIFRFWTGDDTDASIVVDRDGSLYVASVWERHNAQSRAVGQIMKLNARRRGRTPLIWSVADRRGTKAGVWATPALHRDILIAATHQGRLLGIDKDTSEVRWQLALGAKAWPSPVVVDDVLVQGDCGGNLYGFDVSDTGERPRSLWHLNFGNCLESTPAVWKGRIYVGARDGYLYALGDRSGR